MKIRVHYVSVKGSASMIAQAIAQAVGAIAEPLLPAYMPENVRLMFLGCEGAKADKVTLEFIASLNPDRVYYAALFVCGKDNGAIAQMRKALTSRGVKVLDMTLIAPLKRLFGGGPTEQDLARARQFAQDCAEALSLT